VTGLARYIESIYPDGVSEFATSPHDAETAEPRRRPSRAGRGGSLLELAILGLLADGELHGYELKKRLDGVLPAWSSVSFGSLYPTLGRLERAGDLEAVATPSEGPATPDDAPPLTGTLSGELAAFRARRRERPTKTSRSRRGRKVFGITEAGRARLVELLTTLDPADDRAFALQVAFSGLLAAPQRMVVLGRRRAELAARLEQSKAAAPGADRWRTSLRRHTQSAIGAEIAWVDELLAAEGTPDGPPSSTPGPHAPTPTITPDRNPGPDEPATVTVATTGGTP
jgi:DNA-binding PadR family transcriptional regulator